MMLVGEIRDEETAQIAFRAAMTGHLVLTSLHAQNAASAIQRLKDMDVDPGLISDALNCIVGQRLARSCARAAARRTCPTRSELGALGLPASTTPHPPLPRGRLRVLLVTGYWGRVGLFEVMPIRGEIARR